MRILFIAIIYSLYTFTLVGGQECIFCKFINKEVIPQGIFYEDKNVVVMLDDDWIIKGHTLVISKKHVENLSELSPEEVTGFATICSKVEKLLLQELQVNKAVILKSGGLVPHFHFHIYPMLKETPWQTIQDMFNKRAIHTYSHEEQKQFINNLTVKMLLS